MSSQLEDKSKQLKQELKKLRSENNSLRNENNELKQVINSIDANIYWKDTAGKMVGMNRSQLNYLGLSDMNEAIGKRDTELSVMKNTGLDLYKNDLKVIESNTSFIFEEKVLFEEREQTLLSQKSPMRDENGKVLGIVGVSIDITQQKKLQAELEKKNKEIKRLSDNQKSSFQQIIDSIDANIYWKDLEGKFLGMNKKNLSLLGFDLTNEDIIGKSDSSFEVSKNFNEEIYKNDLYVMRNDKTVVFEEEYISEKGKKDTYLATKSCLKNDDGEVIGLVGISVNISKQKQLQKQLEQKNKELEEKDKKRSEAAEAIFDVLGKI
ncbi:MAG: PAS domain-containing protein [Francisella endosymbiont of Hyalomma scupense]